MSKNNLLYSNDRVGEYPASWYAASADHFETQTALAETIECDVCIIGAGFTGLSAALTLAGGGVDVVLLDAHRVGWGASGRNGGQLGSGQRLDQDALEQEYGLEHARALWDLAQASKQHVHDTIQRHDIDCDYAPGIMHVNHKRRFGISRDEVRQRLASDVYYSGSVDTGSGHLHPLKLATGLASAALRSKVRIYENTEVINYKDTGQQVTVKTKQGDVSAKQLLLACNGYLGNLNGEVAASVMPINNYIIATEPLDSDLANSLIRDNMAVAVSLSR